jgi:cobaltochelatase CobN
VRVAAQALGAHLRRTDAAILSRSSHLYAMVSSDDPFQYLGGLSAAPAWPAGRRGWSCMWHSCRTWARPTTETAQRAIALEMQSRYLHPGWLQAQKAEGYAGTLQVLKAVQFAWGWQAVAPDTVRSDHWQSFYDVLVRDKHQLGLPEWLQGASAGLRPVAGAPGAGRSARAIGRPMPRRASNWPACTRN